MKIIVNGVEKETNRFSLGYFGVKSLANKHNSLIYTITFSGKNREGTLVAGRFVELEEGMVFNVMNTGGA